MAGGSESVRVQEIGSRHSTDKPVSAGLPRGIPHGVYQIGRNLSS